MAVMLRSLGIPSRVATGFASGYYNQLTGVYVVRASDAHAWVEAYLPGANGEGTWTTFDPTPAASGVLASAGPVSRFEMYMEAADNFWHEWVVSYDLGHQVVAASQFEGALRRISVTVSSGGRGWQPLMMALAKAWGFWAIALISLIAVVALFGPEMWREWRQTARVRNISRAKTSPSDASFLYQQMLDRLARRGVHKPASATPVEFAEQLAGRVTPEESRAAAEFTALYNTVRFGGEATAATRMAGLLKEFEGKRINAV
jgi:transglutaminase-like putative cysteine protease